MPERPKRRKNKNKRKNKNNRADVNKNNSDVIEKESEASCSTPIYNDGTLQRCEDKCSLALESLNRDESVPEITCNNTVSVNEDFNNDSDARAQENVIDPLMAFPKVEYVIAESQCERYIVESPEQSIKSNPKLNTTVKSKSLDNDDVPKIIDITEDADSMHEDENAVTVLDTTNVLVSDVDSDVEWEKADDLQSAQNSSLDDAVIGICSVTTAPLSVAQCREINISMTSDVETSLRNYLRTLDLSTNPENANSLEIKAEIEQIINREVRHRLRKKGLADDFGLQRLGQPRTLDVIDEEGSGESSKSSRRQSYLNDKKSDIEDLEDDVFEDKCKIKEKMAKRTETTCPKNIFGRLVPQQCMLVGAKIKEPDVTEARGDWTVQTVEKLTGAELVYLTDSSSSTSSIHDCGDETDDGMETDVSVRMITPTIEVTDTENLLKNTFIANIDEGNIIQNIEQMKNNQHIVEINDINNHKDQKPTDSSQISHEIIVLSTDDIQTNLYVKDVERSETNNDSSPKMYENIFYNIPNSHSKENVDKEDIKYDLEIKVLKCELNDAINNLIKEVSDTAPTESSNDTFLRQDSSSSVSSSQCTAKYNPTSLSLNDVSNILYDDSSENIKLNTENIVPASPCSHVKDVVDHIIGDTTNGVNVHINTEKPLHLRDLCVKRIASFPYGDKILEELASVSERLQNITGAYTKDTLSEKSNSKNKQSTKDNMLFYPSPHVSPIENPYPHAKTKDTVPPPLQPRNSSLKKRSKEEEVCNREPTKVESAYICLSPSQKMLMEKTQTVITKDNFGDPKDMHKQYGDRRSHTDQYSNKNQKDLTGQHVAPNFALKSQTGSRLLALIRDPTVNNNVNTYDHDGTSDQCLEKCERKETPSLNHYNKIENVCTASAFKPIPPPRPKKIASSFYESDESSDFTDSSMRTMKSERKFFHFSTGNLNKEIEDDISSIQNMHRYYTKTRDSINDCPRRPSLPKDLCDQQMEYIRQKEKEVEAEIQRLESLKNTTPSSSQKIGPRAPFLCEKKVIDKKIQDSDNYFVSKRRDYFSSLSTPEKREKYDFNINQSNDKGKLSKLFSRSEEELLREKMYSEYVTQMAQREERKHHKIIKITNTPSATSSKISKSMPSIDMLDSKGNNRIEEEFISRARQRWDKLGIKDPETEEEKDTGIVYREPTVIEHKIKVIDGDQEKDVGNLPSHLQDFVRFTAKDKESGKTGESDSGPASPHAMVWCAVIVIVLAVGKYFLRLLTNNRD